VTSVAFYPGIVRSNFAADSAALRIFYRYAPFLVTPQNAGARLVGLATLPAAELTNGAYYEGDKAKRVSRPAAHADDTAAAATVWDASAKAVGL
jgi:hypothetical protein